MRDGFNLMLMRFGFPALSTRLEHVKLTAFLALR